MSDQGRELTPRLSETVKGIETLAAEQERLRADTTHAMGNLMRLEKERSESDPTIMVLSMFGLSSEQTGPTPSVDIFAPTPGSKGGKVAPGHEWLVEDYAEKYPKAMNKATIPWF